VPTNTLPAAAKTVVSKTASVRLFITSVLHDGFASKLIQTDRR
jgi:hypothetical protein